MNPPELIYEIQQPYNKKSLSDELWELKQRIFKEEITTVLLSMSQVSLLFDEEVRQLLKTVRIMRIMGRSVIIVDVQPAVAKVMQEVDEGFDLSARRRES